MERIVMPFVVNKMTPADVPAVAALEQIAFTMPWSIHAFEYEVRNNPMAHFVVASPSPLALQDRELRTPESASWNRTSGTSRTILGYGGLWLIVDEGHICTLAVHPNWRGHGLGELLLSTMVEQAMHLEAVVATLEVRASNRIAQKLYEKYGFVRVGLRKGYYADNHEDALIMTTELLSSPTYRERFQRLKDALLHRLTPQPKPGSATCGNN
jgi:ribosomal-protein-alanine N-acetyltransferase